MESLIINQKKLQATIFTAFSQNRFPVYTEITKENLKWIHGGTGHVHTMNRDAYGIGREANYYHHVKMIESMDAYNLIDYFSKEWEKLEADIHNIEIQKKGPVILGDEKVELVNMNKEYEDDAQRLCRIANPLIEFMAEKFHPHVKAIVTSNSVEIVDGVLNVPNIDGRRK